MIKSYSIHQNPTTWGSRPENTLNMTNLQVFLLKDSTTGNWLHWFPIKGPQTASSTFQQDVWDVTNKGDCFAYFWAFMSSTLQHSVCLQICSMFALHSARCLTVLFQVSCHSMQRNVHWRISTVRTKPWNLAAEAAVTLKEQLLNVNVKEGFILTHISYNFGVWIRRRRKKWPLHHIILYILHSPCVWVDSAAVALPWSSLFLLFVPECELHAEPHLRASSRLVTTCSD